MGKTPAMIAASYGSQDILHSLLWVEAEWLEEHLEKPVKLFLEHCNVDFDFVTHFDREGRSARMLTTCVEIQDGGVVGICRFYGPLWYYCSRVGQWLGPEGLLVSVKAFDEISIAIAIHKRLSNLEILDSSESSLSAKAKSACSCTSLWNHCGAREKQGQPQNRGCPHEICVKRDFSVYPSLF